jgi:hypothetical protein
MDEFPRLSVLCCPLEVPASLRADIKSSNAVQVSKNVLNVGTISPERPSLTGVHSTYVEVAVVVTVAVVFLKFSEPASGRLVILNSFQLHISYVMDLFSHTP